MLPTMWQIALSKQQNEFMREETSSWPGEAGRTASSSMWLKAAQAPQLLGSLHAAKQFIMGSEQVSLGVGRS